MYMESIRVKSVKLSLSSKMEKLLKSDIKWFEGEGL